MTVFLSEIREVRAAYDDHQACSGFSQGEAINVCLLTGPITSAQGSMHEAIRRRHGKIDRVAALALRVTEDLAVLAKANYDSEDVGVVIGNMLGGWEFGQRELGNLHRVGANRVSAFQATAWFPAAAQGEITIAHSLTGYAKTLSGGLACGLQALLVAYDAIQLGKIRAAIVGACESLSSSIAVSGASGLGAHAVGEAACFFLLTDEPIAAPLSIAMGWRNSGASILGVEMQGGDRASLNLATSTPFYLGVHPLLEISAGATTVLKDIPCSAEAEMSFRFDSAVYSVVLSRKQK